MFGPSLPPELAAKRSQAKEEKPKEVGPCLPPHLQRKRAASPSPSDSDDDFGPVLPPSPDKMV